MRSICFFLPSRAGVRMHYGHCVFLGGLRTENAPKPFVSKNKWNSMIFQSWSRHPRDQRGAKDTSKTCSKKGLCEDKTPSFFHCFSEFSASPRRGAKKGAKIASRRLPRSLWGSPGEPPGSQHRSTFRLWAPPGDPSGTPPGSLRSPVPAPGRSRSPPEAIFKPPNTKIIVLLP